MTTSNARIGAAVAGATLLAVGGLALQFHDAVLAAHLAATAFGLLLIGIGLAPQRKPRAREEREIRP